VDHPAEARERAAIMAVDLGGRSAGHLTELFGVGEHFIDALTRRGKRELLVNIAL
jgi:DNA-directed RNA polymerase specialized sigma24 family protein